MPGAPAGGWQLRGSPLKLRHSCLQLRQGCPELLEASPGPGKPAASQHLQATTGEKFGVLPKVVDWLWICACSVSSGKY